MKIVEYDEVDPYEVLQLNLLGLNYALTPERVKLIRQYDPRPFPFFALYASIGGEVAGQVGVFRLPMVSIEGPEDVGGIWAVCSHPSFERRGIASRLLQEAHERMRTEGLRFSTLGTSKYLVAHPLYYKHGYRDVFSPTSLLLHRDAIIKYTTSLTAEKADSEQIHLTDNLFRQVSVNRLGFSQRFDSFIPVMVAISEIEEKDIWLLWKDNELKGYFIVKYSNFVLKITDILLTEAVNPIKAISSLVRKFLSPYIQITSNQSSITESLSITDALIVPQNWNTFMMKPLTSEVMNTNVNIFFGIGTDQFLISWMDTT
ncbi:MAG: GNAT family N-acetyltransferase [Promethearchaeota archaeon]